MSASDTWAVADMFVHVVVVLALGVVRRERDRFRADLADLDLRVRLLVQRERDRLRADRTVELLRAASAECAELGNERPAGRPVKKEPL